MFLSGALLLVASVATAGMPTAANSTLPNGIQLVGMNGGVVDAKGQAVVIVRDEFNNSAGSTVTLVFDNCASNPNSDLNLASVQPFLGNGCTISAPGGTATFRVLGGAKALPGNNPGITTACCTVLADGVVLGTLRVGAYDLNSSGGVNAADIALFLGTLFASPAGYRCRADYNGDGLCNSADLAKIMTLPGLTSATAPFCF
jgi:hypothetical protein